MTAPKPKIFLSYAHEDIGMAKKFYRDLKRYGLDVWINCESLMPGQNWKITIEKTIKQSQYYLLLLSSHSITKRGFIQKEMKIAYEMLEQCSEDDIYLIPVRLNDCVPSLELSKIHYIDIFPDNEYQNGLKRILQVVNPVMFLLRNNPIELNYGDIVNMIRSHDFCDSTFNLEGKGFFHHFRPLIIVDDKVIVEEVTGLTWQQSGSDEQMNFEKAENWIKILNKEGYAGFHDWRLPTLEEAMSLMEPERKSGNLYIDHVFDSKQSSIWTSDLVSGEPWAWFVDFEYGGFIEDVMSFVRAVRSG